MKSEDLRIRMIGNAHLDPAWMWEWGEGMEAFIATCRSALARMEETPGFVFSCSSAAHYRWVERAEPELFEEIRRRVDEGRWEVVGGWWTQADCNIPSGEGLIRQGELAQEYFQRAFGRRATVGYSPDAFGHTAGLPQILRIVGLGSYIFCRPDPTELELPGPLFRWLSTDGSEVLAYRVPFHYNMYQTTVRKKVDDLRHAFEGRSRLTSAGRGLRELKGSGEWALFYGVGNHGGGPTREQIGTIREIAAAGEVSIDFGRLDDFFAGVNPEDYGRLERRHGGLQMNSPGTYSVHSGIKQANRRSESELLRAEALDLLAASLDPAYTSRNEGVPADLRDAWRQVCFNHFHDILCGVAIRDALDNGLHRYGEAIRTADTVAQYALRSIARRIDTSGSLRTVIAFNPHSFPIEGPLDVEIWHDIDKEEWGRPIDLRVVDSEGKDCHVQRIETRGKIGDDRVAGRFHGTIPPLGWKCWELHYGQAGDPPPPAGELLATENLLQNEYLRLEFSDQGLTRMLHRPSGIDFLSGPGARPIRIEDQTDTWGHGDGRFDRESPEQAEVVEVDLVESGDLSATLRVRAESRQMRVLQWFTLHRSIPRVDVRCRIENREEGMVKLSFDTPIGSSKMIASGLYDTSIWSPDGLERPGGFWKGLSGEIDGQRVTLGIADTLTHGFSAEGGDLRLSILRSVSYATHEPHPMNRLEDRQLIDIGTIEFRYRLRPIVEKNPRPLLERDGLELNRPPIVVVESPHDGGRNRLPRTDSQITISNPDIVMTACRREEDGSCRLRLFETSGEESRAVVELGSGGKGIEVVLRGHEVREIKIQNSK